MDVAAQAGTGRHNGHTRRGAAQREALVRAAFDLIAERGFEGLRTRDIAARAGVNIATLHYYFATKEDLIRGVVDALIKRFRTQQAPALAEQPRSPLIELRQELQDAQYQIRESPEMFSVLFELVLRSLRDSALRAILRDMEVAWREHIETYLREGAEQGVFRKDLDITAAATAIVALVKGSVLELMASPDTFPTERFNQEVERWLTGSANQRPNA
ncbi:MAG TPA: TetR/AcrR family transcriptional regulator [Ktedonobacterales bacterium]|nr:TetR/AcrR family transcriptional regulator [Ktedonobacterales bacterium]